MKLKDYVFGVLAGFNFIVLWYGQLFLGWLDFDGEILMYVYPVLPAVLLFLLVRHNRIKNMLLKLGLALLSIFLFGFLAIQINLGYILLNIAIPGYGRLSGGGYFAGGLLTIQYLIYNGIAVFVSFGLVILQEVCKK